MKRRSITSGRVVLTLPKDRSPFPLKCLDMLENAFEHGQQAAQRIHGREKINKSAFPEMETLIAKTRSDIVLTIILKTMFFAGLNVAMQTIVTMTENVTRAIKFNSDASGAYLQQALTELFLCLDDAARLRVLRLYMCTDSLQQDEWIIQCTGALAVTRTAHALLSQGLKVYLPSPTEDVVWKIDLLARIPGESESYCFSIKSDRKLTTGASVQYLTQTHAVRGTKRQQDFLQGVRRFERYHLGCYVAVELFVSAREDDLDRDYVLSQMIEKHRSMLLPAGRRTLPTKAA